MEQEKLKQRIAELERGIECFNRSEATLRESIHSRDATITKLREENKRLHDLTQNYNLIYEESRRLQDERLKELKIT